MKNFLIYLGLIIVILVLIAGGVRVVDKLIPLYPGYMPNLQSLKIVEKLSDREIKKIILDKNKELLTSEILIEKNDENYKAVISSLRKFPDEGEYRRQSLRLDSIVAEYSLLINKLSKLKTDQEKEEVLKEYLEVDKLEVRYFILF